MSSISSADEDQESIGDDTEQMSSYYKASGGMGGHTSAWQQDPNMDPGKGIWTHDFETDLGVLGSLCDLCMYM